MDASVLNQERNPELLILKSSKDVTVNILRRRQVYAHAFNPDFTGFASGNIFKC
jgi:hypothetical protein